LGKLLQVALVVYVYVVLLAWSFILLMSTTIAQPSACHALENSGFFAATLTNLASSGHTRAIYHSSKP